MNLTRSPYSTPIHLVDYSPWPLLLSLTLVTMVISENIILNIVLLLLIVYQWFRDITREGKKGDHTIYVQSGLKLGFLLFIVSEVMVFVSLFWAYFHSSLSPSIELSIVWPPLGIDAVSYLGLPLLGSVILLSSGFVLTLSHYAYLASRKSYSLIFLFLSIVLGASFLYLQYNEYIFSPFTIADSVYGSVFYMTTGLHALHVFVGVLFLFVQFIRLLFDHFTLEHHLGFEFAIFYWHFVDVVWLFVFLSYYWWGS